MKTEYFRYAEFHLKYGTIPLSYKEWLALDDIDNDLKKRHEEAYFD